MTIRAKGPLSGLDWLRRGLTCGRCNPRAVFGGAAVLMTAALVPSVVQALLQLTLQPGELGTLAIAAVTTLLSAALLAPLMGGYLRLIHACAQGRPVHAREVFATFRSRHDARRLIAFAVALLLVQLLAAGVLAGLFRESLAELQQWMAQVTALSQQARPGQPVALPPPPQGMGGFLGLGSLLALFVGGMFAVGLGQVALGGRGVGGALADGFAGAVRNLLPLLVLAVLAFGLMLAVSLGAVLVVAIVALLHPALAAAVLLPLYVLFLIALYAVLFGVAYHLWRDVAGEGAAGGIEVAL